MRNEKYKEYKDFLMKEKLSPITIGHIDVTKKQKKMAKFMRKETIKKVNKRLDELEKITKLYN